MRLTRITEIEVRLRQSSRPLATTMGLATGFALALGGCLAGGRLAPEDIGADAGPSTGPIAMEPPAAEPLATAPAPDEPAPDGSGIGAGGSLPANPGSTSFERGSGTQSYEAGATLSESYDAGAGDGSTIPLTVPSYLAGETVTTLATGQSGAYDLAVDGTSVYWVATNGGQGGTVMKVPVDGGALTTLASNQVWAGGIALDATNVYWVAYPGDSSGGAAMEVPLGGGTPTALGSGLINDNIAVNAIGVYGTDGNDSLAMVPLAGGDSTVLAPGPGNCNTYGVALDATSVYWSNFCGTGPIMKAPLAGGPVTTLAEATVAFGVAVDATNVYWANGGDGTIMGDGSIKKVPVGGGAVVTLASGLDGPDQIAIDATYLYATTGFDSSSGSIIRVPLDGGPVTTLASGLESPSGIAIDATSVYWTTIGYGQGSGAVMKLTPR